jgi:hypothetical protein
MKIFITLRFLLNFGVACLFIGIVIVVVVLITPGPWTPSLRRVEEGQLKPKDLAPATGFCSSWFVGGKAQTSGTNDGMDEADYERQLGRPPAGTGDHESFPR